MGKEIRIELFRLTKPRYAQNAELQNFINGIIKKGWEFRTIIFHSDILTYEILFEKSPKKNNG